ncbi:MAG: hypothetical protein SFY96_07465 [Planctomycetota bacterium]|nr:hypothetical protein [Planctomycetota bacterium]
MSLSTHESSPASGHSGAAGPDLPEVKMHLLTPAKSGVGRVVSNTKCTAGRKSAGFVRHVAIDIGDTPLAGQFRAGQSFGVIPPGVDPKGASHKLRLYSIASPTRGEDGQGRVLATTVKRLIDEHNETEKLFLGVASNYLCDLKPGDEVTVTGPNGKRFLLPSRTAEHDYVFFATGTGIAPFRGMLLDLLHGPDAGRSRVVLVMGSPYASDLLYHEDMLALAAKHPNFTYLTAISREKMADAPKPLYVQDRLETHRELLSSMLASPRGLVYVCGIAGMELGILQKLTDILPQAELEQYLQVDAAARADVKGWNRKMLHKEVRPTRRVFLEVY